MLMDAKTAILNSGDFLNASEVSKLAGFSASKPSVQPNKWKCNRNVFAIQHGRDDYFPFYALNPDDHRPRKQMAEILRIFGEARDGWEVAFWFAALNSFLDDERPQDVLAVDPDRVIAAAKDEVAGVRHGESVAGYGASCKIARRQSHIVGCGRDHVSRTRRRIRSGIIQPEFAWQCALQ